uniref:ShKT domain-containing protein n=1 Tax=Heterorhabditis bacteriophora TaxID=37862 RepID=A0A1I7XHT9_HETBA
MDVVLLFMSVLLYFSEASEICTDMSPYCNSNDCAVRPGYALQFCKKTCGECQHIQRTLSVTGNNLLTTTVMKVTKVEQVPIIPSPINYSQLTEQKKAESSYVVPPLRPQIKENDGSTSEGPIHSSLTSNNTGFMNGEQNIDWINSNPLNFYQKNQKLMLELPEPVPLTPYLPQNSLIRNVVANFLRAPGEYGIKKSGGRPIKLRKREKEGTLKANPFIRPEGMRKCPTLTADHEKARMDFVVHTYHGLRNGQSPQLMWNTEFSNYDDFNNQPYSSPLSPLPLFNSQSPIINRGNNAILRRASTKNELYPLNDLHRITSAQYPNSQQLYPYADTSYLNLLNSIGEGRTKPKIEAGNPRDLASLISLLGCHDHDPTTCSMITDETCYSRPGFYLRLCPVRCRNCNGKLISLKYLCKSYLNLAFIRNYDEDYFVIGKPSKIL